MIIVLIILITILGIRQGKLAKVKLKNPDTLEKQRFMEWRNLELKANSWFLWAWILVAPITFFSDLLIREYSGVPFGYGVGIIFMILMAVPGALFSSRAQRIRKEMGFSARDAMNRKVTFN